MKTNLQNDRSGHKPTTDKKASKENLEKAYQFVKNNPKEIVKAAARVDLLAFSRYMQPSLDIQPFHKMYYHILNEFAHGKIKKLIITMPPQHGKSEGASRKLPAFILGLFPDKKIFIGSYAAAHARDFNRDVQKIIDTPEYAELFPETFLSRSVKVSFTNVYQRNSDVIEIVGKKGSLRTVGRGGSLTGKSVDISILDDVYKDYEEANSPVIRNAAWKWYTTVVRTRLDNNSQEIIVYTRWHSDDIVGRLEKKETIIDITSVSDLNNIPEGAWVRINFPAIKKGRPTELDPRKENTSLWENKHSLNNLLAKKKLDEVQFDCLYQGEPGSAAGKLYTNFKTYEAIPVTRTKIRKNYTDTADTGKDKLCSIDYIETEIGNFILDILYTDKPMEYTEPIVAAMLYKDNINVANIESNNGGRGFARQVKSQTRILGNNKTKIEWFHQTANKESRIYSRSNEVMNLTYFPADWEERFPDFAEHIKNFKRDGKNEHDDAEDCLTGTIEMRGNHSTEVEYYEGKQEGKRISFVMPDNEGKFILLSVVYNEYINIESVIYSSNYNIGNLRDALKGSNEVVFECDKAFFPIAKELRNEYEVRILKRNVNPMLRITAQRSLVTQLVRFNRDYTDSHEYTAFMDAVFDEMNCIEAMDAVSAITVYIKNKYA